MEFIVFLLIVLLIAVAGSWAAYRNGVNDGYMAALEPWNPGYQKAKSYLIKHGKWEEGFGGIEWAVKRQHREYPTIELRSERMSLEKCEACNYWHETYADCPTKTKISESGLNELKKLRAKVKELEKYKDAMEWLENSINIEHDDCIEICQTILGEVVLVTDDDEYCGLTLLEAIQKAMEVG